MPTISVSGPVNVEKKQLGLWGTVPTHLLDAPKLIRWPG